MVVLRSIYGQSLVGERRLRNRRRVKAGWVSGGFIDTRVRVGGGERGVSGRRTCHDVKNVAANLRQTRSKKFIHSARYDAAERNVVAAQPTTPHHPPSTRGQSTHPSFITPTLRRRRFSCGTTRGLYTVQTLVAYQYTM